MHPGGRGFVRIPKGDLMRFEWAFGQIPQGGAADWCIIIAKNWELASAWYKKLCHWHISELIVVKRANDDLYKKKICVREYEIAKQAGVLSTKSAGLQGNIYK